MMPIVSRFGSNIGLAIGIGQHRKSNIKVMVYSVNYFIGAIIIQLP